MRKIHPSIHGLTAVAAASALSAMATPSIADFQNARVTNNQQSEVVRQRFFDSLLYPLAGQQQLSFFSLPIGQGVTTAIGAAVGSTKSQFDTNLVVPNSLPSGANYLIDSIEVLMTPGSSAAANTYLPRVVQSFLAAAATTEGNSPNDVNVFYQSGMLELNILSKNYLREAPLLAFPPKAHFDGYAAIGTNSATTAEVTQAFLKASGRPYYVEPRISLQSAVNFDVTLRWPAAVALPSGFNGKVAVYLDGYAMRASQ